MIFSFISSLFTKDFGQLDGAAPEPLQCVILFNEHLYFIPRVVMVIVLEFGTH